MVCSNITFVSPFVPSNVVYRCPPWRKHVLRALNELTNHPLKLKADYTYRCDFGLIQPATSRMAKDDPTEVRIVANRSNSTYSNLGGVPLNMFETIGQATEGSAAIVN